MADEDVVKVFHAARQDLEIFWKLSGVLPTPLFDTQVAAMVCGYGEQVSYSELVQSICHVGIDKSSRFTDWARRPLAEAQINYAIADVTHLRDVYKALSKRVAATERQSWLDDEMKTLTSAEIYEQHPERAWERYKSKARKPRDLAVLMELAAWRESEAQARDVPRSRVLKDDVMVELALAAPRSVEALGNLRAFPRGMERSRAGGEILAAIERGLERDPKTLPRIERERRNGANVGATVELLKVLLRQVSEESGVAGKLIATVDDLEAIAAERQSRCGGASRLAAEFVRRPRARAQARAPGADGRERQGRHPRMEGRRGAASRRLDANRSQRRERLVSASADIVWLRDDFRLDDQPCIHAAADRPALFVYVHDETGGGARPLGGAAKWRLAQSLTRWTPPSPRAARGSTSSRATPSRRSSHWRRPRTRSRVLWSRATKATQ